MQAKMTQNHTPSYWTLATLAFLLLLSSAVIFLGGRGQNWLDLGKFGWI